MSRRRLQRGFSCDSECSSGFCPEPTALHHCVRGSTKGVSGKMNTLKFRMEKSGLRINLRKTKNLVFGINMGLPNKS